MPHTPKHRRPRHLAAVPLALLVAAGLTACGGGSESANAATSENDPFWANLDSMVGKKATVTAEVNEVLNAHSFTITAPKGAKVKKLLVVSSRTTTVEEEKGVKVVGTLKEGFDATKVAKKLGVEWNPERYAEFEGKKYLVASEIDTSVEKN